MSLNTVGLEENRVAVKARISYMASLADNVSPLGVFSVANEDIREKRRVSIQASQKISIFFREDSPDYLRVREGFFVVTENKRVVIRYQTVHSEVSIRMKMGEGIARITVDIKVALRDNI